MENPHRTSLMIAFVSCAVLAYSPGVARADLAECFTGCTALASTLADSDPATPDEISARCATEVPACAALDAAARAALSGLCDSVYRTRARPATDAVCILPDGTSVEDARHRCRCPESAPWALDVTRGRSARPLPIEVPAGRRIYVCFDPLALPGSPGSADERLAAAERDLAEALAAERALCAPREDESLTEACARSRTEFLALGSSDGPVDLEPLRSAIAAVEAVNARQDEDLAAIHREVDELRETESIDMLAVNSEVMQLSEALSILVRCVSSHDPDLMVRWTGPGPDGEDVTQEMSCRNMLNGADSRTLDEARRIAREEVARAVSTIDAGHAFAWLQAYGLAGFNPLTYGNVSYGNPWQVGAELTVGVGLGGGWNFHGGIGIAYGGPDMSGVTNVAGEARIGVGATVIPEVMIGFGVIATHRFLPDVFSATSLYGGYGDVTIRFLPRADWSPVLTLRLGVGGSPRQAGTGWSVELDGLFQGLIGVAHF